MDTDKPGYKTSEFWVTLFTQLISFAAITGFINPTDSNELTKSITAVIGGVVGVISIITYIMSRTELKKAEIENRQPEVKTVLMKEVPSQPVVTPPEVVTTTNDNPAGL